MASICSVSCSEFFITVTVLMSRQTQQIACAKVSMPRFRWELNRLKCMQSKKHSLAVAVRIVLFRESSMTS